MNYKLAYILNRYPHGQTNIVNEMKALESAGIDVHIIALRRAGASDPIRVRYDTKYPVTYLLDSENALTTPEFISQNIKCLIKHPMAYSVTAMRSMRWMGSNFKLASSFANVLAAVRPTLVYVNWSWATCGSVMYACRILNIPFIFSVHGTDITPPSRNFSLRISTAQKILTPSKGYAEILENKLNVPKDKIRICPYCLDNELFFEIKPARYEILKSIRIISVGTLRPVKRHEDLIHACSILRKEGFDIQCRIFGEGPDHDRLESLISELSLVGNVVLVGHVSQEDLPEQYEWSDISVHTSENESFCFVVIEAQASGRPVVTTDAIGGIRQSVKPGQTAVMVPVGKPQELARAIMNLANNPEKRLRMGQKGREFVEQNFTYEHFSPRFLKALFD